jgi:hypothetical protein
MNVKYQIFVSSTYEDRKSADSLLQYIQIIGEVEQWSALAYPA